MIIKKKKVLSIGDNLNTDIKGANLLNYDSLIISNGIHKDEIKKEKPTLRDLNSCNEKSIAIKELVNEIKKIIWANS